jgi:hypothetical protein
MYMKALILGCSHALGAEMSKQPGLTLGTNHDAYGAMNSYPVQIAQKLGYTALNHAISGGSNDAMYRIFCDNLSQLTADDVVIACWTGGNRGEVFYEHEQRWLPISHGDTHTLQIESDDALLQGRYIPVKIQHHQPFEDYGRQWLIYEGHDQRGHLNKVKNILALNMLAQSKHIPVINIDSFWPITNHTWPSSMKWPVLDKDFMTFCQQQNFPRTDWGHFFLPAHSAFADYVLKNIAN